MCIAQGCVRSPDPGGTGVYHQVTDPSGPWLRQRYGRLPRSPGVIDTVDLASCSADVRAGLGRNGKRRSNFTGRQRYLTPVGAGVPRQVHLTTGLYHEITIAVQGWVEQRILVSLRADCLPGVPVAAGRGT